MARRAVHEASSSSSSSSSKHWMYDVFLSFRGEDTRNNFTGHLYMALKDAGINAFIDDNELRRGENITKELVRAIQGSKISVIVFSRRYADSGWCLEELVKIMECRKTVRQMVLPIFYDVDPSDVRKQSGSFAEAFKKHKDKDTDKVVRWKAALVEAANLSGWDLRNTADGHEAKFLRKIIDEISRQLQNTNLHLAVYPVGIESRVQDMSNYLHVGLNDVRMVGILGMGGIGKTTIAKAIYNKYSHCFDGKSFLSNVRENAKQHNGMKTLQEKLLSDILHPTKIELGDVDEGISVIKKRIGGRKVLVIIDDVDQLGQLNKIARNHDWFGPGSRIIITTRDEQLLKQLGVDTIYRAQEMNEKESLELFSWHACKNYCPNEAYTELSRSVVAYCGGLPLALEVLGSFLFGRSTRDWKSTLDKLKKIPCGDIQEQLEISFEGLSDDTMRDIFLDISCFFIGTDMNHAKQILDGCDFFADIGISVLLQRCLITVSETNKLLMHDLLRDMGREIVRKRSLCNIGKCSRLWHHEDVINVLTDKSGTEEIEGLTLDLQKSSEASFSIEAFSPMKRLRLLQLNYVKLNGDYKYLSKKLRWLCWHGFPLKFIPNNFNQQNLVNMDLQYSNLIQVWKDSEQLLEKLKVLNLSHSHYLTQTPNFSKLPSLEQLILKDCKSLFEVHQSIGHLERLALVNLQGCKVLKDLPGSFYNLKSIETLVLSGCSKFENLGEDLGEMVSLKTLTADNTAIKKVPSSIVRLKNLEYLSLCGLKWSPSNSLPSRFWSLLFPRTYPKSTNLFLPSLPGLRLRELYLRGCNIIHVPKDFGSSLPSLEELDLGRNSFHSLPSLIVVSKLDDLLLDNCPNLFEIQDLPPSLTILEASDCPALEKVPNFSEMSNMSRLHLNDCPKLIDFPNLDKSLNSMTVIRLEGCTNLSATLKESILKGWIGSEVGGIFLPGSDIPDWFTYVSEGCHVSFQVPQTVGCNLKAMTVCIVYSFSVQYEKKPLNFIYIYVINHTQLTSFVVRPASAYAEISGEVIWQGHLLNKEFNLEGGDLVLVYAVIGSAGFKVKKIGVSLVSDKFISGNMLECESIPYADFLSNTEAGPSHDFLSGDDDDDFATGDDDDDHFATGSDEDHFGTDGDGDGDDDDDDDDDDDRPPKRLKPDPPNLLK